MKITIEFGDPAIQLTQEWGIPRYMVDRIIAEKKNLVGPCALQFLWKGQMWLCRFPTTDLRDEYFIQLSHGELDLITLKLVANECYQFVIREDKFISAAYLQKILTWELDN